MTLQIWDYIVCVVLLQCDSSFSSFLLHIAVFSSIYLLLFIPQHCFYLSLFLARFSRFVFSSFFPVCWPERFVSSVSLITFLLGKPSFVKLKIFFVNALLKMETPSPFYDVPINFFRQFFSAKKSMIWKGVWRVLQGVWRVFEKKIEVWN